jgi:hypothetical protein
MGSLVRLYSLQRSLNASFKTAARMMQRLSEAAISPLLHEVE